MAHLEPVLRNEKPTHPNKEEPLLPRKKRMMDIVSGKLFLHYVLFVPGKETVIFLTLKQNLNH